MIASHGQELRPRVTAEPTRRWWKWLRDRRVICPCGHHIPENATINDTGFIRCQKWIAGEKRECGRWVFVFFIRGGGYFVAEVSLDERDEMRDLMTPAAMLDYLGIFRPPGV